MRGPPSKGIGSSLGLRWTDRVGMGAPSGLGVNKSCCFSGRISSLDSGWIACKCVSSILFKPSDLHAQQFDFNSSVRS